MKLSCSDFTGWTSSAAAPAPEGRAGPAPAMRVPVDGLDFDDADTLVEDLPLGPFEGEGEGEDASPAQRRTPSTVPSADALADVLGPLFDRTDEVPALPFVLDTPVDTKGLVTFSS